MNRTELTYDVSEFNVYIKDSYQAKKREMPVIIAHLRHLYPENPVFLTRSNKSLIREWRTHNLLYSLHIARERTADVDLNLCRWYVELAYNIIGSIVKPFIK